MVRSVQEKALRKKARAQKAAESRSRDVVYRQRAREALDNNLYADVSSALAVAALASRKRTVIQRESDHLAQNVSLAVDPGHTSGHVVSVGPDGAVKVLANYSAEDATQVATSAVACHGEDCYLCKRMGEP